MKYLTQDEIQRLLVRIDNPRDKLLIQLGFVTGCRVSEVVSIAIRGIKSDRIEIWDEKKDCYREVVIDSETRRWIEEYIADHWMPKPHKHHQLFYFSTKTANRILKYWFREADIPVEKAHWHTLRHTYVIHSLESGVPLNHVCAQTGDSANMIIRTYGAPSIDKRIEVLETAGRYWVKRDEREDEDQEEGSKSSQR